MSTTVGKLPQYQVEMCLSSNPLTFTTMANRLVSCQISRGRVDELGAMQTSTMSLVLDNGDGAFSPDNAASPYTGYLVPGRRVRISARFDTATAWNPLFYGYIDSIRPEDNGPLDSNVIIQCMDWLGKINIKTVNFTITSGGPGPHDLVNSFNSLMAGVDSTVTATMVNPTDGTSQHLYDYALVDKNALSAVQEFAETVRGVIFAGADGTVRATANGGTAVTTLFNTYFVFDQPITNNAANVVPYTSMDYDLTTQYLYNDITVTATQSGEGPQNAQDAASITAYGKRSLKFDFAYMGPNQAAARANVLMLAYRNPKPRIHALVIDVDATTGVTQSGHTAADLLFQLDITAPVTVVKAQPGSVSINRAMVVEGIKHDIKPGYGGAGPMHEVTLQLSETTNINPTVWQLGISQLGISTILGYGPPPFDPTSISGCTLYLRSDAGVQLAGGLVSAWYDQSGNSRTATAGATKPIYVLNGQAGESYVEFDLAAAALTLSSNPLPLQWSAFAVAAINGSIAGRFLSVGNGGAAKRGIGLYDFSGGSNYAYASDTDGTNSAAAESTYHGVGNFFAANIFGGTGSDGQPVTVYVNGQAGIANSAAAPLTDYATTVWTIGGGTSNTQYIYCVICYNRVLTTTERNYIINGLNTKYLVY